MKPLAVRLEEASEVLPADATDFDVAAAVADAGWRAADEWRGIAVGGWMTAFIFFGLTLWLWLGP